MWFAVPGQQNYHYTDNTLDGQCTVPVDRESCNVISYRNIKYTVYIYIYTYDNPYMLPRPLRFTVSHHAFQILIQKRSKKDFVQPEFVGLSKALASSD